MNEEYKFKTCELEQQIPFLKDKGITEFSINDDSVACDKKQVLKILSLFTKFAPDVFLSIKLDALVIDRETVQGLSSLFCSVDIPLKVQEKGGKLLFDKKFYTNKAKILNDAEITFGFQLTYAQEKGDTLKLFMDRLDFALNQYPNHIDFPQTENSENPETAKVTGLYSAQDIRYSRDIAFACRTFYSAGRAVPWFLSVLKPLRIYPSKFFADFSEWQHCNNCDYKSGFLPEAENHKSIEKMQILFLEQKYEEKKCPELFQAVKDIVILNGAMSRLAGEGEECEIKTSYHPDDLLGFDAFDIASFCENVCMENCQIALRLVNGQPDIQIKN